MIPLRILIVYMIHDFNLSWSWKKVYYTVRKTGYSGFHKYFLISVQKRSQELFGKSEEFEHEGTIC